ncbi:MAG TPA: DNA polymerase III subunit gamma/tau [Steroidobacteraceae bacterium]
MAYTALARKWRPHRFSELTGQEHVVQALSNALASGRLHHAYLFAGTRGVGKTTVARILAKCLNCERGVSPEPCGVCASCTEIDAGRSVDLIEVDAASRTKVDDTRELLDNVQYVPTRSRFKIYLIDEVHMLSAHSFNALLKTLEEPPPHVKFLLATTEPQKLPVTVLSRCLQFNLKRLSVTLIAARLKFILESEQIKYEPAAIQLLAEAGDGSLRDALSLLDQLLAFGNGAALETAARAMLGTVQRDWVVQLVQALATGDAAAVVTVANALEQWSPDYEQLLQQLAALLERVALRQLVPGFEGDELHPPELLAPLAAALGAEDVQLFYQTAICGRRDLGLAPDLHTGFRMTLLRMLAFRPAGAAQGAIGGGARTADRATTPRITATSPVAAAPAVAGEAAGLPDWPRLLAELDLTGAARQLAGHCVLLGHERGVVRLAIDPRSTLVRTPAMEEKLAQALTRHFGERTRVAIELREAQAETPAQAAERNARQLQHAARAALEADPVVQALQERFGASIHPDSVRPAKPA